MNSSPEKSQQLAKSLSGRLSGEVFVDEYRRALYSTDASPYQIQPLAVVLPRDAADAQRAMAAAAELSMPLVSRGGGTSLSGQSIGAGLVLDFSKYMNRILALDPVARTARIEPGVVLDQLNAAAAAHGLQFGPDVATSNRANLGGMIGNNSAGARSILHGKTVDHVISLEVLLAGGAEASLAPRAAIDWQFAPVATDRAEPIARRVAQIVAENRDEILARFPRIVRRVSGYNLDEFVPEFRGLAPQPPSARLVREAEQARYPKCNFNLAKLIVGSEGSLACVTEALVHLVPLPKHRGILALHFDSMKSAVAAVGAILACQPSAVELLDGEIVRLAEKSLEYRRYLDFVVGHPESLLLVEFSGDNADEVRARAETLTLSLSGTSGLFHILPALTPELCNHVWACRKAALPLLMGVPGARKPIAFVEDTAVDPARLPEFVERFGKILADHGTRGAVYGHASVGCLHIRPMLDMANRDDLGRMQRISRAVCQLVIEFGGAMSGEHGDGLARSYLNEPLFGPKIYEAFRQIKAAFDPHGLMNPGKIVEGPSPIANLRQGSEYRPLQIATQLNFDREGGLARAAEMCNGAGVCRKLQTGTMCPSFMATGDEEHSTRGRANALRLVLSGALPAHELTGDRLFQTFDLCLQCKGCKAECPSNVDVAKLKAEFLHHYYETRGVPLGVRAAMHVAELNRLGSLAAPVSNWIPQLPGVRWLGEKLLGIDRRRPLPRFERENFLRWFQRRSPSASRLLKTGDWLGADGGGIETTGEGDVPVPFFQHGQQPAARGPIVLLDDCLTSYCEPGVGRAAVNILERAGYEVHLAGLRCCGRPHLSTGQLTPAKTLAIENITRLLPWVERGVPIVGCEPSCLLMLADDYRDLIPSAQTDTVAQAAVLLETHLVRAGVQLPFAALEAPGEILLHGHCHQKALVGMRDTVAFLQSIPNARVRQVDSGCCGMAGSFGYSHYDLSLKIGERVLLPAVRAAGNAIVAAPGFSCRQQIHHGAGRTALHPIEVAASLLR